MSRRCRPSETLGALVLALVLGCGGGGAPEAPADTEAAADPITTLAEASELGASSFGVLAVDLETGETLLARDEGKLFIPASTLKLLTTYAALLEHGPEYRFSTRLYAVPSAAGLEVSRRLILRGGGDPFLADGEWFEARPQAWRSLAEKAVKAGLRRVAGPLVADASLFGPELVPFDWSWGDLDEPYAAPISSLSAGHNTFVLRTRPGSSAGRPARLEIFPELEFLRRGLETELGTRVDGRPSFTARRQRQDGRLRLEGEASIAEGGLTLRRTVDDPAAFAGHWFAAELERRGLEIAGGVESRYRGSEMADEVLLGEWLSEPLAEIVAKVNRESDNLGAECLLRSLAAGGGGPSAALRVFEEVLQRAGFPALPAPRLVDGSGLSRTNLVTAEHLVWVLVDAREHGLGEEMALSLARAGEDRRLARHPLVERLSGRVLAKTGSFRGTHCLAGYLLDHDSHPKIAFAIMINGLSGGYAPALAFEAAILEQLERDSLP